MHVLGLAIYVLADHCHRDASLPRGVRQPLTVPSPGKFVHLPDHRQREQAIAHPFAAEQ